MIPTGLYTLSYLILSNHSRALLILRLSRVDTF